MDPTLVDDRELVGLALQGRDSAYREIVSRYQRPIFSLIHRMVRDSETSEDLSQETFLKAFRALSTFDPEYRFSSWIFKIANNIAIDHLRRRRIQTVSLHPPTESGKAGWNGEDRFDADDGAESPLDYTESRELGARIEEAIGVLRPEYRTAILLRHVEGYSYDEIAEVMELPLGTVKTYLHRARAQLQKALRPVVE